MADPILIWGAGAIGGTLGAYWARAGIDVFLVDIVAEHVEACRTTGINIEGPVEEFNQKIAAATPDKVVGEFSRVVLAVKAQHTAAAVTALKPHLAENGFVLSAQNGLNEIEISRQVGEDRTMGAFVNFGADWLGPGRILFGNRGAVVVGEIAGRQQQRTQEMFELLQVFEPDAVLTENIWGFLWGKLAYGAMLFATALNMDSMADNFADPKRFPVWRTLGAEVMRAAAARSVTPVGFDGFDPASFSSTSSDISARQSVADLATFNRGSAKTHSGIWRDLAVRKRRTEVDPQIGIIAKLSAEAGIETPAINRLVELVHDVEAGRRFQSSETFNELLAICP
ncbi:ketopantoate reductase family protein [Gemmatimonadota bacterium]